MNTETGMNTHSTSSEKGRLIISFLLHLKNHFNVHRWKTPGYELIAPSGLSADIEPIKWMSSIHKAEELASLLFSPTFCLNLKNLRNLRNYGAWERGGTHRLKRSCQKEGYSLGNTGNLLSRHRKITCHPLNVQNMWMGFTTLPVLYLLVMLWFGGEVLLKWLAYTWPNMHLS